MLPGWKCCSAASGGRRPVTDQEARKLLETYQQSALQDLGEAGDPPQDTGFVELEPELTMLSGGQPWLRLRIANRERGGSMWSRASLPCWTMWSAAAVPAMAAF